MALVKLYNSTKVISDYAMLYSTYRNGNFCPSSNAMLAMYWDRDYSGLWNLGSNGSRVWKDGTQIGFVGMYVNHTPIDYCQSLEDGSLAAVTGADGGTLYNIDPISLLPILSSPIAVIGIVGSAYGSAYNVAAGQFYSMAGQYLKIFSIADGSLIDSFKIEDGYVYNSVYYRSTNKIICVNQATRRVAFYDLTSRSLEYASSISEPFKQICFDWKSQVFQTIRTDGSVAVYSCDVAPGNLSNPVLVPVTVSRRMGNKVYVDLTGDGGEGVANYWIKWYLSSGQGYLEKNYSKTDSTGRAWNYYWAPEIAGGSNDINVEVVV